MRLEECEEKIDFAAEACDLDDHTVKEVKRAIGTRKRLNLRFPNSKNDLSLLPTQTVLELGKKDNAAFLEEAIPILKEKIETGVRPTKKEVVAVLDAVKAKIHDDKLSKEVFIEPDAQKTSLSKSVFNTVNENIEWAKYSWNPVTGCKFGCKYCYARDIANRFYPEKFEPTFRPERLDQPQNTPVPKDTNLYSRNVFVCSMADLFGDWVPQEWIDIILEVVRATPQWTYIFLTKNPKRLATLTFPDNAWVGTTIDTQARVKPAEKAFEKVNAKVKFISVEPLMEELTFTKLNLFNWIIIGGRSHSSGMPEGQPEWKWVEKILVAARESNIKVYFKPNLTVVPKEYP